MTFSKNQKKYLEIFLKYTLCPNLVAIRWKLRPVAPWTDYYYDNNRHFATTTRNNMGETSLKATNFSSHTTGFALDKYLLPFLSLWRTFCPSFIPLAQNQVDVQLNSCIPKGEAIIKYGGYSLLKRKKRQKVPKNAEKIKFRKNKYLLPFLSLWRTFCPSFIPLAQNKGHSHFLRIYRPSCDVIQNKVLRRKIQISKKQILITFFFYLKYFLSEFQPPSSK